MTTNTLQKPLILILILSIFGCAQSTHPLGKPAMGKPSSSEAMERLINTPGPIQLQSINSADWVVPLGGLVNLKNPVAIQAGLKDRDESIQVYAHLLKHPQRGNYLVDTGVSKKLVDDPGKVGVNWMIQAVMKMERMKLKQGTAEILQGLGGPLAGVFFTHLHLDHITGMPDIPNEVPLFIGKSESTGKNFMNVFVQGATDKLLLNKAPLQEWLFSPDPQNKLEGVIDIFEDGSVFAISVSGHTPGSVAYLIRTPNGPVLLTGDTCHTRWGWDNTVEPGDFTNDQVRNLENLKRLKSLVASYPKIDVRVGHQR